MKHVAVGMRGAKHVAHPLSDRALCGAPVREVTALDAYANFYTVDAGNACWKCESLLWGAHGNEERQAGAYA